VRRKTVARAMINLIYDGDIGPDPCDFSTISMLHEYHERGMINLMGVMGVTPDPFLASTFSLYNQIHGHDIPIGAYREGPSNSRIPEAIRSEYYKALSWACRHPDPNRVMFEKYGNTATLRESDVLDSVQMYRSLLATVPDDSVTIYAAGQLYNFESLLRTGPDHYSELSGAELLQRKVCRFVFMGGYFPDSSVNEWYRQHTADAEWNWWGFGSRNTSKVSLEAIAAMGKPVTYIGAEQGVRVLVGREVIARLGRNHPTTEAFLLSTMLTDQDDREPVGLIRENPAYDEMTLYHVVEDGVGRYFDRLSGRVVVDENGANRWLPGGGNESYLTIQHGVEPELGRIITDRITGRF
jgi:hypothetical protein